MGKSSCLFVQCRRSRATFKYDSQCNSIRYTERKNYHCTCYCSIFFEGYDELFFEGPEGLSNNTQMQL